MKPKIEKALKLVTDRARFRMLNGTNNKAVTLKMPADLLEQLRVIAEREHRSISGQVVHYLREILPEEKAEPKGPP